MTKPLQSASIAAPGFFGLNTQESGITLESGYALQATNCVIDKYGRLGARKGWSYISQTNPSSTVNLKGMHRFLDIDGDEYFGTWSDDKFYISSAGTLTEVNYNGSQTITTGNWQAVTLNDHAYLFQAGYEPIYFSPGDGSINDVTNDPDVSGTPPQGNTVLSAYGRLWVANTATNKTTIYWSDLLNGSDWDSGTAGSLDLSSILVYGNDEIIGLGAHNGLLVVFCKQNIILFDDSETSKSYLNPATLQLVEVISGVGCIARDSIQSTGTDIIFLSESGLRSLGRVIQEKSTPMRDLSKNIRDDIVQALESEPKELIKSCYSESNAFYLLAFPTSKQVYCFDMRGALQDGSARVTVWNNMPFTSWLAYDGVVYMTHTDGIASYRGYTDNFESYRMVYFTNYFDLGTPSATKILKRLAITVIGATGQDFVVKSGFDYSDIYNSYALRVRQGEIFEYNSVEYGLTTTTSAVSQGADTVTDPDGNHYTVDFLENNVSDPSYNTPYKVWLDSDGYYYTNDDGTRTETILYTKAEDYDAEYVGGTLVDTIRVPASGTGSVFQLGFEAELSGGALSIQKMDVYVKQGRTL
jgi:hypothetical protein